MLLTIGSLCTLKREFVEEVGMTPTSIKAIGGCDFFVRWERKDYTHEHHIALFYEETQLIKSFMGKIPMELNGFKSTPCLSVILPLLVLQVIEWLTKGVFSIESRNYDDWLILS